MEACVPVIVIHLTRTRNADGELVVRLRVRLLDEYLEFLAGHGAAHAYDFRANRLPGATARDAGYWRDAGTLDSYHGAQMDLCAPRPAVNLANSQWPILPQVRSPPPEQSPRPRRPGRAGGQQPGQ
jgi:hypothetical protein